VHAGFSVDCANLMIQTHEKVVEVLTPGHLRHLGFLVHLVELILPLPALAMVLQALVGLDGQVVFFELEEDVTLSSHKQVEDQLVYLLVCIRPHQVLYSIDECLDHVIATVLEVQRLQLHNDLADENVKLVPHLFVQGQQGLWLNFCIAVLVFAFIIGFMAFKAESLHLDLQVNHELT